MQFKQIFNRNSQFEKWREGKKRGVKFGNEKNQKRLNK